MNKVMKVVVREVREVIPVTTFFLVAFHLVLLTNQVTLKEQGITPARSAQALVAALIVGKAVLIADKVPLARMLGGPPLWCLILARTGLYMIIVVAFRFLEELIPLWVKYGGLAGAQDHLVKEVSWPRFWLMQLWLLALLLQYTFAKEFLRAVGHEKARGLLLAPSESGPPHG